MFLFVHQLFLKRHFVPTGFVHTVLEPFLFREFLAQFPRFFLHVRLRIHQPSWVKTAVDALPT